MENKQRADGAVDALAPHVVSFSPGVNRPAESSDTNVETAAGRPSEPRVSGSTCCRRRVYVSDRKMAAASSGNALCSGAGGDEDDEDDEDASMAYTKHVHLHKIILR